MVQRILYKKKMSNNPTEEKKNEYRSLKKAAKKTIAKSMKEEAAENINMLGRNPNNDLLEK